MSFLEGFPAGAVSVFILVAYLQERGDDLPPVERAKRDYREGRIEAAELERRLEFHLDDRNEQIRAAVLLVANVGHDTADAIVRASSSPSTSCGAPTRRTSPRFTASARVRPKRSSREF